MFVPDKLKLNKFVQCNLPTPRSLFAKVGMVKPESGIYTGEDVVPHSLNKTELYSLMDEWDAQRQRDEQKKED